MKAFSRAWSKKEIHGILFSTTLYFLSLVLKPWSVSGRNKSSGQGLDLDKRSCADPFPTWPEQ